MMLGLVGKHDDYLTRTEAFCALPSTKLIVDEHGNATMCCHQNTPLGNIFRHDVLDLWRGKLAEEIRHKTAHGDLHPVCRSWNTCPYLNHVRPPKRFEAYARRQWPTHLEICLPVSHCNIGGENPNPDNPACIMCIRNHDFERHPPLTDQICHSTKHLMPYLRELTVLGIAEPFWKDEVFRVFDMMGFADHADHVKFSTNTNGTCWSDSVLDRFFSEVRTSAMSVSIDAATADTFIKIRRLDAYDLICRNIRKFLAMRASRETHYLAIYNNINLLNVHELVMMVEMAADLGVDELHLLPTHDQMGRVELGEILLSDKNVKLFRKHMDLARNRATELQVNLTVGNFFDRPPPTLLQLGIKRRTHG